MTQAFVLGKSGLSLSKDKVAIGARVPVPVCFACLRTEKDQGDLIQKGEESKTYYLCAGCEEDDKPIPKKQPPPAVFVRPWDNPQHDAFLQKAAERAAKTEAGKAASREIKRSKNRGRSYDELLADHLQKKAHLIFPITPEIEAEGMALHIITGWEGFCDEVDGTVVPLEHSYEQALAYLSDYETQHFTQFVKSASQERKRYESIGEAEDGKN
ncbi:MAG: hypothetical protein K0U98_11330 [Deltaproteobacteria bacterium]|nr:hypothetical protein [Deltaproteobacteria bacterium]